MSYTYATVIVEAKNQAKAQKIAGDDTFVYELSADGTAPATHFLSSGPFDNSQLEAFIDSSWKQIIRFGNEPLLVMEKEGFQPVQVEEPEIVEEPVVEEVPVENA